MSMTYEQIRKEAIQGAISVGFLGGVIPIPAVDAVGVGGVLARAIYQIAHLHKRDIDMTTCGKLSLSVLSSVVMYQTSMKVFQWMMVMIPGGVLANMGISAVLDALIVLRMCSIVNKTMASRDFTTADAGECVYLLLAIPTLGELSEIARIAKEVLVA